jgi:hypothetical protein
MESPGTKWASIDNHQTEGWIFQPTMFDGNRGYDGLLPKIEGTYQ